MKRYVGIGSTLAAVMAFSASAYAETPRTRFDIPAQDLGDALRAFARASGKQVAFEAQSVQGKQSQALAATLSAEEALAKLLRGTDLLFTRTGSGIFLVRRASARTRPRPVAKPSPAPLAKAEAIRSELPRQDIVVTARKREELAFSVPIALSVISGEALERRGVKNLADILPETPGVGTYDQGNGLTKLSIRGTSTSLGGNENGYYLDDLPFTGVTVPIAPDVRAWDIERVEILRGPQGTLFGEGSMGGTVRILTKSPNLHDWEAKGAGYVSQTEDGGSNSGIKGAINAPIIPDLLALRVAATREKLSGWIDDEAAGTSNVNDQSLTTFRAKLRFDPLARLSITSSYWYYNGVFPGGSALATDAGTRSRSFQANIHTRYQLYSASARYEFAAMQLYYSFSHNRFDIDQSGSFLGEPLSSLVGLKVDAQEGRLTSMPDDPMQWTVGGYSRTARRRDDTAIQSLAFESTDITASRAYALFGETTYTLRSTPVDITAGLRYYREVVDGSDYDGAMPTGRHHYESWNPRFSLAWHPISGSTLYISASKGFRAGQLQPSYAIVLGGLYGMELPTYLSQDSIWTYEVGAKASLFEGMLALEGAAYYSRWKNMAVRIPIGATGTNGLLNSPGTKALGIEAGAVMAPANNLTISANASYVHAVYAGSVNGTGIVKDAPADDLPRFTASASAEYSTRITSILELSGRVGWQHSSPRHFVAFPGYLPGDAVDRVDARIGLVRGNLSVSIFADNVTNERGAVSYRTVQVVASNEDVTAYRLRPRTIGLEVTLRFQPS